LKTRIHTRITAHNFTKYPYDSTNSNPHMHQPTYVYHQRPAFQCWRPTRSQICTAGTGYQ